MNTHQRVQQFIRVSDLRFDPQNYRLPERIQGGSQADLLRVLEEDFDLLPVGESIADHGYFPEEPLVVVPGGDGKYTVVEGNRRLAALKLLVDPQLRRQSLDPTRWEALAERSTHDLSEVPCIVYERRDQLIAFLGYRHIAGILKWDPLAKARFITELVERKGDETAFRTVARETGSRAPTIRDNYIAYRIVTQAKEQFDIDTSRLEKDFSVFYRSLSTPSITRFIGVDKNKTPPELRWPVPEDKGGELGELVGFIHGTRRVARVLTDSRHLTKLGEILENEDAIRQLRLSRNLELAYSLTGGEERRLIDNLDAASFYLDEALRDAHRHTKSEKVSRSLYRAAKTLEQILKNYPDVQNRLESGG